MKQFPRPIQRVFDRLQRRFVRARSGSVLILVVALLVLMALIGTAFMTMAQFDRAAATQHTFNTEVDLLMQGVINQVEGIVAGDLFVNTQYRPATVVNGTSVNYYDSAQPSPSAYNYNVGVGFQSGTPQVTAGSNPGTWWLGSRLPGLSNSDKLAPSAAANYPLWPFITGAINGSGEFDSPLWEPGAGTFPVRYSQRSQVAPYATDMQVDGQIWPAFALPSTSGYSKPIMAADADGDGIADSGLVKLFTLDGITYYAAVRIVDNSAAINASIAQTPNPFSNYTPNQFMPGDLSPVNLDFEGMLVNPGATYAQWLAPTDLYGPGSATGPGLLTNFRFNYQTLGRVAIDDYGNGRPDFSYLPYPATYPGATPVPINYYFDQQWLQLGRRLRNPGYAAPKNAANPASSFYQALPLSESIAMARNFVLRDPSVSSAANSSSVLEMRMPNTMFTAAVRTSPYAPTDTINWFSDNFDFGSNFFLASTPAPNVKPMRALVVAQNPVSNFSPEKFNPTPSGSFQFGDIQTYNGSKYVCICSNPPVTTPRPPDFHWTDPYWAWEPWTNAPTKTSVNTATFQQLYAAYWAVMADQYVPGTPGQWAPAFPNPTAPTAFRMFRSPIRDGATNGATTQPTTPALSNQQVMQLRAAIAAVNTMALRHSNPTELASYGTCDVISRTVYLTAPAGGVAVQANVYGAERQPFITQVYARNDKTPDNSWMAVEIYNPYPQTISLTNWVLAAMDRSSPGNLTLTTIGAGNIQAAAPGLLNIAPQERVVLMSNLTPPNTIKIAATAPGNSRYILCSGLSGAFGKELVLMRPRLASGMVMNTPSNAPNNFYSEKILQPADLIPIDSYDFTNIPQTAPTDADVQEWWYMRPNDPTANKQWHFVFPGPWMLAGAATGPGSAKPPTWSGTYSAIPADPTQRDLSAELGVAQKNTFSATLPANAVPWANYHDTAIQVNNVDFGGPNKPALGAVNALPLGAFPRNGDILQVTYIGAYRLSPLGTPTTTYELNPITADSAMATASDQTDGQEPIVQQSPAGGGPQVMAENVGRFCPIDITDSGLATPASPANDFLTVQLNWRYHWANRLFDFLTVQAPQDDYFPDVDPWANDSFYPTVYRYPPAASAPPLPVANVNVGAANAGLTPPNGMTPPNPVVSEDTAPVDGLVNVNSAPWRVLAAIPWYPATSANYRVNNANLAVALAYARDVNDGSGKPHGPFRNLFELGEVQVPGGKLRDIIGAANSASFTPAQGNLAPLQGSGADVKGDFQAQFNAITRISNLVTTRSDSFTAYVLIQGWRNAETASPHLVVQRRAAVIIDRSGITPTNRIPSATNVPQ